MRQARGQNHKFWAKFGNSDHSVSLRFAKKKSSNRLGKKSVLQFCQSSEIGKNEKKKKMCRPVFVSKLL